MSRRYRSSRIGTSRLAQWWPVLLSLLVVLVPTVCVLWFMTEAVENRRLVVRRALADADFTVAQERLQHYWDGQAAELEESWLEGESPSAAFRRCILEKLADSVVYYGGDGQPVYPAPARSPPAQQGRTRNRLGRHREARTPTAESGRRGGRLRGDRRDLRRSGKDGRL